MQEASTSPFTTSTADKAARAEARSSLLAYLPLLRHLSHGSPPGKSAIAQSGLLEALNAAWRSIVVMDALALEALLLLAGLVADSFDARHILASVGRPPLLLRTIRVIFRCAQAKVRCRHPHTCPAWALNNARPSPLAPYMVIDTALQQISADRQRPPAWSAQVWCHTAAAKGGVSSSAQLRIRP
jgi:hypothetical protein